jgi:hypothetical protein
MAGTSPAKLAMITATAAHPCSRGAAEQVARYRPQVVVGARVNRAFLARVVRYPAARRGICQFVDIGSGLPADLYAGVAATGRWSR